MESANGGRNRNARPAARTSSSKRTLDADGTARQPPAMPQGAPAEGAPMGHRHHSYNGHKGPYARCQAEKLSHGCTMLTSTPFGQHANRANFRFAPSTSRMDPQCKSGTLSKSCSR